MAKEKYDPSVPSEYDGLIEQSAQAEGISPQLLRKTLWNESRFKADAQSPTGPRGIAQFTTDTAQRMGLKASLAYDPNDDRFKPELAIPAAAKLYGQLVKKFGGDELKASLAYNQGEGPKGRPQLEAYDRGDYGAISAEGLGYMRNHADVAKSSSLENFMNFGGITPKAKSSSAEEVFGTLGDVKTPELPDAPAYTGWEPVGKAAPKQEDPYSETFWEQTGKTMEQAENDKGIWSGSGKEAKFALATSLPGMAYRGATQSGMEVVGELFQPGFMNKTIWQPSDFQKMRDSGLPASYINAVSKNASPETLDDHLKIAKRTYEMDMERQGSGIAASLTGGIIGAVLDPLSYVPIVGQAGKGMNMIKRAMSVGIQSGALNVGSEFLRESMAGVEGEYKEAMLGGFIFGAGMDGIIQGATKLATKNKAPVPLDDDFIAPLARMEAREKTLNSGGTDDSLMPPMPSAQQTVSSQGVPYMVHPTEPGAVVLDNGSILSATNPANPKLIDDFAEVDNVGKARLGVNLGGLTEMGQRLLRSDSQEVRNIASRLVRSTTGMEGSGASGVFNVVAGDVKDQLGSLRNAVNSELTEAIKATLKEPQYSVGMFRRTPMGYLQEIQRKAAEAIEDPSLFAKLSPGEQKVSRILGDYYNMMDEFARNPAIFGDIKAIPVMQKTAHSGRYVPRQYDPSQVANLRAQWGDDGAQEAAKRSLLASYAGDAKVRQATDDYLMESLQVKQVTPEMVEKYANDQAYGITQNADFQFGSKIDDQIDGMVGIENNNFLETRNTFRTDFPIQLPDGTSWSVNELRNWDMASLLQSYGRRMEGDIAVHATGSTVKEVADGIAALKSQAIGTKSGKLRDDAEVLEGALKVLTGRARRNDDNAIMSTAIRSMTDLGFFSKNAYMGLQNLTEIAGMLSKGNVRAMLHGIPMMREWAMKGRALSGQQVKDVSRFMFGKEIDDSIRPSRQDIVQRIRETSTASPLLANGVGSLKYATQEMVAWSPWTKLLNGTTNYLIDTARQGVLSDIAESALSGKRLKWASKEFLNNASVTKAQYDEVLEMFRQYASKGPDGRYTLDSHGMRTDPRQGTLYRIADRVADETIMRTAKVSTMDAKAYSPGVKMALQFKNFTLKSLNGRFIRDYYAATQDGRAIDVAMNWVLSAGLASAFYVGSTHLKALGLQEADRKKYLEKALDEKMIAYAGFSRSSHMGAPLAAVNLITAPFGFDQGKMVRTSIIPNPPEERTSTRPERGNSASGNMAKDFYGRIAEQVPALGFMTNVAQGGVNAAQMLNTNNAGIAQDYRTALMRNTMNALPNDALTQQVILHVYNEAGINHRTK